MSVEDLPSSGFKVVPNPATDRVVLQGVPSGSRVTPVDLLGRPIAEAIVLSAERALDSAHWPRGWVMLRVETEAGVHVERLLLH